MVAPGGSELVAAGRPRAIRCLAIKWAGPMTEPSAAIENFGHLIHEKGHDPQIDRDSRTAWSDPQGMTKRTDEAALRVQFASVAEVIKGLGIRRKSDHRAAVVTFGGCWINGYVLARLLYGSALNSLHYSRVEDDIQQNGQRLIDYSEAIDLDSVLRAAPEGVAGAAASMLNGDDVRMAGKYGRKWQAAGVTCYANGIRVGIAEQELFGTPPA